MQTPGLAGVGRVRERWTEPNLWLSSGRPTAVGMLGRGACPWGAQWDVGSGSGAAWGSEARVGGAHRATWESGQGSGRLPGQGGLGTAALLLCVRASLWDLGWHPPGLRRARAPPERLQRTRREWKFHKSVIQPPRHSGPVSNLTGQEGAEGISQMDLRAGPSPRSPRGLTSHTALAVQGCVRPHGEQQPSLGRGPRGSFIFLSPRLLARGSGHLLPLTTSTSFTWLHQSL